MKHQHSLFYSGCRGLPGIGRGREGSTGGVRGIDWTFSQDGRLEATEAARGQLFWGASSH